LTQMADNNAAELLLGLTTRKSAPPQTPERAPSTASRPAASTGEAERRGERVKRRRLGQYASLDLASFCDDAPAPIPGGGESVDTAPASAPTHAKAQQQSQQPQQPQPRTRPPHKLVWVSGERRGRHSGQLISKSTSLPAVVAPTQVLTQTSSPPQAVRPLQQFKWVPMKPLGPTMPAPHGAQSR
jgi:hypothetical protein